MVIYFTCTGLLLPYTIFYSLQESSNTGRRVRVRRRVGEKFHQDCLVSTVKFGGGKIQVWGCMCRDGVGSLHVVEGRLNARAYIDLISQTLKEDY